MMEERNMKRKTLSLLLVLVMALSLLTACGAKDAQKRKPLPIMKLPQLRKPKGTKSSQKSALPQRLRRFMRTFFPTGIIPLSLSLFPSPQNTTWKMRLTWQLSGSGYPPCARKMRTAL